jgi:hypothetical protein
MSVSRTIGKKNWQIGAASRTVAGHMNASVQMANAAYHLSLQRHRGGTLSKSQMLRLKDAVAFARRRSQPFQARMLSRPTIASATRRPSGSLTVIDAAVRQPDIRERRAGSEQDRIDFEMRRSTSNSAVGRDFSRRLENV